jgi:hypothetical protein
MFLFPRHARQGDYAAQNLQSDEDRGPDTPPTDGARQAKVFCFFFKKERQERSSFLKKRSKKLSFV